jgi:hypothetical protein
MKINYFWNVKTYSLVDIYSHEEECAAIFRVQEPSALKKEVLHSSKMFVITYQTTHHHI